MWSGFSPSPRRFCRVPVRNDGSFRAQHIGGAITRPPHGASPLPFPSLLIAPGGAERASNPGARNVFSVQPRKLADLPAEWVTVRPLSGSRCTVEHVLVPFKTPGPKAGITVPCSFPTASDMERLESNGKCSATDAGRRSQQSSPFLASSSQRFRSRPQHRGEELRPTSSSSGTTACQRTSTPIAVKGRDEIHPLVSRAAPTLISLHSLLTEEGDIVPGPLLRGSSKPTGAVAGELAAPMGFPFRKD